MINGSAGDPHFPVSTADGPSDREVVFRRLLDAPPELVWKVWSDPEHLHRWFGPAGFTLTTLEFESAFGSRLARGTEMWSA